MINIKDMKQELQDEDLIQVSGGATNQPTTQKDIIKDFLTKKAMYNVARPFEMNLLSALAVATNTNQKNITVATNNGNVVATINNVARSYDEIMNYLTGYFGTL